MVSQLQALAATATNERRQAARTDESTRNQQFFLLYLAYTEVSTFVKLGSCQDSVVREGKSLPDLTNMDDRQNFPNLMARYQEVQRQVAGGPTGKVHFLVYQPSASVAAWLDLAQPSFTIAQVEAALRSFLETKKDGGSLLQGWAPLLSIESSMLNWSEQEVSEIQEDTLKNLIYIPEELGVYNLSLRNRDPKMEERIFSKITSKQELLPRVKDGIDLIEDYRSKMKFFTSLPIDDQMFKYYFSK